MPSKLALHHNTAGNLARLEQFYTAAQPEAALHLDLGNTELPQMIKRVSPRTRIVFRKWFRSQPLNSPEARADEAVRSILDTACGRAGLMEGQWAVVYNEIGPHPTHDYMRFSLRATQRLHENGIKSADGNWSVGTPDVPDWRSAWFTEPARAADALALHEYCAPSMDDPRGLDGDEGWFTLRYKKMLRALRGQGLQIPIIFTECGIDSGAAHWDPGAQGGWRSFTASQDYLRQLKWYDSHLQQEPLVLGACIFCIDDASGDWTTFDVKGEMLDLLQNYMAEQLGGVQIVPYPDWLIDLRSILPRAGEYEMRASGLGAIRRVVMHHSDSAPTTGPWQIAEHHIGEKGWPGHGYHADIAMDGRTWHCQDWDKHAYHAGPANGDSIGICLLGSFMNGARPTPAQIDSTVRLIAYLERMLGRTLEIVGHREAMVQRECPGDSFLGPTGWKRLIMGTPLPPALDWQQRALAAEDKLNRIERIVEE